MEKRNTKRHAINASTIGGQYSASADRKICDGKMLNYNKDGMCIESSAQFKKGASVLVRVNALISNGGYSKLMEGFRTVSLAEVKWSKPSQHDAEKVVIGMSTIRY